MAQRSRQALKDDVPIILPSGSEDGIIALNHRALEQDILDSHFNLITDYSNNIRYASAGSQTVYQKIEALQSQVNNINGGALLAGRTASFIYNSLSVGQNLGTVNGVSCTVAAKSGADTLFTFNFNSVGTSNYTANVIFNITKSDWNGGNDIVLTTRNCLSSSFQVAARRLDDNPEGEIRFALIPW